MSTKSFIPPKFNWPLMWVTDFSMPILFKVVHNLDEVSISPEDKKMLQSLQKESLVYISNHPTTKEPPVAYTAANIMSSRFHYMASREVFEWGAGFVGEFIQNIGAFSILAGSPDRESMKKSREILSSKGGKLVLFPEGEPTSGMNDTLLPFQSGVSQLGFWGLEDALKKDANSKVYVVLSFVKYRMNMSIDWLRKDVDSTLTRMEDRLGISKTGKDIVHRILSVGRRLIEREEREYNLFPEKEKLDDFDYRIGKLRHTMLDNIATKAKLPKWDVGANAIEKLRKILTILEMVALGAKDPELPSLEMAKWARQAAQKAYDYISFNTAYLRDLPSAERIYEFLYRYENELFGESRNRPHKAFVRYAKPFLLNDFYADYRGDKKGTVEKLTQTLRSEMERLLEAEVSRSSTLFPENFLF